ncbi:MAG: LuxR family transcriptional regulator [Verrucomicrobiaceae bacterium]|nr:MAG: LuxR family transcriptional regulator [Verrucomicrobiaceae bacterium]
MSPSPGKFEVLKGLTSRERECFQCIVEGKLYKEIAVRMDIRLETVRSHIRNIYQKLGVKTRTEAAVKYLSMPTNTLETPPARKMEPAGPPRQQQSRHFAAGAIR